MGNNTHENRVLREVERTVLDERYKRCSLLGRRQHVAIAGLLRAYAQVLRDLRVGKFAAKSDSAKTQIANQGARGMAHCLRWVLQHCPSRTLCRRHPAASLPDEAMELIRWGVEYDPLWNQHSSYSRGLVKVAVDEVARSISFLPMTGIDPTFFCTQVEAQQATDVRSAKSSLETELAKLAKPWIDTFLPTANGLRFDVAAIPASGAIEVVLDWLTETCLPELSGETSFAGCRLTDIRRVLAGLFVYSLFVTRLEEVMDDDHRIAPKPMPHVIALRQSGMAEWLSKLSQVERRTASRALSVLTFDPSNPHLTIAQQPIVRASDGTQFFLPRLFTLLDIPLVFASALNRSRETKREYDRAINRIESVGVSAMVEELKKFLPSEWQFAERRSVRTSAGNDLTPDIVVVSRRERAALVVDVKYATPPFGPADIHHDLEEMANWQAKMREYMTSFRAFPDMLIPHFRLDPNLGDLLVQGIIILRWPIGIPVEFGDDLNAVDWPSLQRHIAESGTDSIESLIGWARRRPDVSVPAKLDWKEKRVQVDDWTYTYSVLAPIA